MFTSQNHSQTSGKSNTINQHQDGKWHHPLDTNQETGDVYLLSFLNLKLLLAPQSPKQHIYLGFVCVACVSRLSMFDQNEQNISC